MTDLTFDSAQPASDDLVGIAAGHAALLTPDARHGWRLPTLDEVPTATTLERLGTMNGRSVWLATLDGTSPSPAPSTQSTQSTPDTLTEVQWLDLVSVAPADVAGIAARAIHMTAWRAAHRFCGACGQPTQDVPGMVARRCGACGQFEYIKAQPVALVAIWRRAPSGGAEVLLARHTYGATQYWALVGGYLDAAESLEDAAIREAAEEVGLGLTDVRYYGSAGWGIAGPSVMLTVFLARAADPTAEPVVDGREIAEARYFPIDRLPANIPPRSLIAGRVLADLPSLLA